LHNLQEELNESRNRIVELNTSFIEDMDKKFAISQENRKRRMEDGESSQELLKTLNIDLTKITEYNQADAKRAQSILEQVKMSLKSVPKEALSKAQDQMRIDEILATGTGITNPLYKKFFINNAIAGREQVYVYTSPGGVPSQGNCGDITYGAGSANQMTPWCLSTGTGPFCYSEIAVVCTLWFLIPREYLQQSGTLTVTPDFDIHGFFWNRANMVLGTTKEAAIALRMQTNLFRSTGPVASTTFWTALNYDGHNIDQSGRFDYTGYNNSAIGTMQVPADEPAFVQIVAELDAFAQGAGSMGLLNFNGEGNAIKIPNLRCVLYPQPVNYP
jgi:hypothetical protein